jgi:hypothetical protein
MSPEPVTRATRSGWSGWLVPILATLICGTYLLRGQLGGEERLVAVLVLDLAWLGWSWFSRRPT